MSRLFTGIFVSANKRREGKDVQTRVHKGDKHGRTRARQQGHARVRQQRRARAISKGVRRHGSKSMRGRTHKYRSRYGL